MFLSGPGLPYSRSPPGGRSRSSRRGDVAASDAPLFPHEKDDFVTKEIMVVLFRGIAKTAGKPAGGITGHMRRVSGARRMARDGMELWQSQLFARWGSSVVLRYVREAPIGEIAPPGGQDCRLH